MNKLTRMVAAARRGAARLLPAGRRDWAAAVWAEAHEVPPGLTRLAWRAGGVWMLAREGLPRRIGRVVLFAAAAAAAAWAAWPDSSASVATPVDRVDVITMVALLAGLPLLARPFLGPAGSRTARFVRVGTWAALLALIPAEVALRQFRGTPPGAGIDLRLYLLIAPPGHPKQQAAEILILVIMALYVTAILWVTSRRARIAPATLAVGTGAGIAFGLVMYTVAPLGLSKEATNPWLPGSDSDPLVLLAWLLVFFGPVAAAVVADRRYTASSGSSRPVRARVGQMMAAGLLTSMVGALFVTVLGSGTTAVMVKAAWLRDWLYHGSHLLYGVQNLSVDLKTLSAIAYSHELTGSADQGALFVMCLFFPLIALLVTPCVAGIRCDDAAAGRGDQRPGGGGPPGPDPAPDPPAGGRPSVTDDDVGQLAGLAGLADLHEPGPDGEQDGLVTTLADAAV